MVSHSIVASWFVAERKRFVMSRRVRLGFTCWALGFLMSGLGFLSSGCEPDRSADDPRTRRAMERAAAPDALPSGIFAEGCPEPERSVARRMAHPEARLRGPDALGSAGDYLLMNSRAAFVVEDVNQVKTEYYYGGILIDAVAVAGCGQAAPERLGEVGVMVGRLDTAKLDRSVLRAFRGERVEIVNDGADGAAAVVRVTGQDDVFWIGELELIRQVYQSSGAKKELSQEMGLTLAVDYILAPDSAVLEIAVSVINQKAEAQTVLAGFVLYTSDTTRGLHYEENGLSVAGVDIKLPLPWLGEASAEGSYAFDIPTTQMGKVYFSGVTGLLDLNQLVGDALDLGPAGGDDTRAMRLFVSVGAGDLNSAVRNLRAVHPDPLGFVYDQLPVAGRTHDLAGEGAVPFARVAFQASRDSGDFATLDEMTCDGEGRFSGQLARFQTEGMEYRLVGQAEGRAVSEPLPLPVLGSWDSALEIGFGPRGAVRYQIRDSAGQGLPAKISLYQNGELASLVHTASGHGVWPLPPGRYEVSVTRGFEYSPYQGQLSVPPQGEAVLEATLFRNVDTSGFLSVDTHTHSENSADSDISIPGRVTTAAAEGLEVVVSTDHEFVTDLSSGVTETGLGRWVATVIGEEVTATVPEHTNMYPVPLRPEDGPRGGPVRWYGKDLEGIYAAERARGAGIVQLNHPQKPGECNYMCLIDWDPLAGRPRLSDPTMLGLPARSSLWSWDFDAVELMNGPTDPFASSAIKKGSAMFDDWVGFLNLGHRVCALGSSDVHGTEDIGSPRSYFASGTDEPALFTEDQLVRSIREGRVVVSAGAFARVRVDQSASLGDTVTDTDGRVDLWVHIEAIPEIDVTHFKVFLNCDEILTVPTAAPRGVIKFDGVLSVPVSGDANLVVVGFGKERLPRGLAAFAAARIPRFVTNPVYIDTDGNGRYDPPGGKACHYRI